MLVTLTLQNNSNLDLSLSPSILDILAYPLAAYQSVMYTIMQPKHILLKAQISMLSYGSSVYNNDDNNDNQAL
jgi:hypothetical protein